MTIYANIGSNQGDRHALIEQAVALIALAYPHAVLRRSEYYESEPWGYASEAMYLNLGIAIDCEGSVEPFQTLSTLLRIQNDISVHPHRDAQGNYCDRPIDIDLIAIDFLVVDTRALQLPHPRAALRDFVMTPLSQLAPPALLQFVGEHKKSDASV